ncbi:hypothetical protein [Coleofasciculus sp. FACHB-1120]|uniref:hypothetical protein n=1 Tax=Coleofasciculus sp. FACHB-1120 TaxID=2692783 RepID=UPI00168344D4|nr:hypothetical protein [Coleofasciculus sp. FACHB-1120]MBD2744154.1 hypothetical protein [Coleofasciculus sp. FACHB-1120]
MYKNLPKYYGTTNHDLGISAKVAASWLGKSCGVMEIIGHRRIAIAPFNDEVKDEASPTRIHKTYALKA